MEEDGHAVPPGCDAHRHVGLDEGRGDPLEFFEGGFGAEEFGVAETELVDARPWF